MGDIAGALEGPWASLRFLLGFVVLPMLYVRDSEEVHRAYSEFLSRQGASPASPLLSAAVEARTNFFQADRGLVLAAFVMLATILLLGDMSANSRLLLAPEASSLRENASLMLGGYGVTLMLGSAVAIRWQRMRFFQALCDYPPTNPTVTPNEGRRLAHTPMPPSGYNVEQSSLIGRFLQSCAASLAAEARQRGETVLAAARREINDIERELGRGQATVAQEAVLRLTLTFYQRIVVSCEQDPLLGPEAAVGKAVEHAQRDVSAIHVASSADRPASVVESG